MSDQERLIDAKISLLQQLAKELNNIQKVCKVAGIARPSFYEIKKAYEQFGREGLRPKPKRRPRMPNETPPEIVEKILDMILNYTSITLCTLTPPTSNLTEKLMIFLRLLPHNLFI